MKQNFSISRLHTSCGIFRVAGSLDLLTNTQQVVYAKVEFMGTDGWCEIDLDSPNTVSVLSKIEREIIDHLGLSD